MNVPQLVQLLMLPWLASELLIFRSDWKAGTGERRDGFSRPLTSS